VLPEGLQKAGAEVSVVSVYETVPVTGDVEEILRLIEDKSIRYITFASSSSVTNFLMALPGETLRKYPDLRFACIGPVTAKTLEDAGLPCHVMPEKYTMPSFVEALVHDAAKRRNG
jgi:Uroporphyrinogen-III synthase